MDDTLELKETVSLPLGSPYATPTLPHYLSVGTSRNVVKQLEIGSSQLQTKRGLPSSLNNICHPTSAWVLM